MSNPQEETRRVLEFVTRVMADNPGMSFDDAWAKAKRSNFRQPDFEDGNPQERIRTVQNWISRLMRENPGISYDDAWDHAKRAKELEGIFLSMTPKPVVFGNPPASPYDLSRRAAAISREARKGEMERDMESRGELPSPSIARDSIYG